MRWILIAVALGLPACKTGKKSTVPGKPVNVTVTRASYDEDSDTPEEVKKKCKFDEAIAEAIVEATPGASLSTGSSGKTLSLTVATMRGVEPDWQGESKVILRGKLEDGGVPMGSFRIVRSAVGGVFGGLGARCKALDDIAEQMAPDIAAWLQDPKQESEL